MAVQQLFFSNHAHCPAQASQRILFAYSQIRESYTWVDDTQALPSAFLSFLIIGFLVDPASMTMWRWCQRSGSSRYFLGNAAASTISELGSISLVDELGNNQGRWETKGDKETRPGTKKEQGNGN
jgi:hypothetical protein